MTPLVLVLGPTGSGKSALALELAEHFNGEIVNCDSVQLYRGFDIGTAKPTQEQRNHLPHHLYDLLDASEHFTAGDYVRAARLTLQEISGRGRLPIIAGGTGFYARSLVDGLFPGPARDEHIRKRLIETERRRAGFLYRALLRLDTSAASNIHPNDANKLIRALEVCLATRRPLSESYQLARDRLTGFLPHRIILSPPRFELHERLHRRCWRMLEMGFIHEVALLLLSGVSADSKPFEAIGYKEMVAYLQGRLPLAEAVELMQRNTRRYAKRQLTWLRREAGSIWFTGFGEDPEIRRLVIAILAKHLNPLT